MMFPTAIKVDGWHMMSDNLITDSVLRLEKEKGNEQDFGPFLSQVYKITIQSLIYMRQLYMLWFMYTEKYITLSKLVYSSD